MPGLFSVVIPAYKCSSFIGEAILSVLNQSDKQFEVIVIDDCSPDNTWQQINRIASQDNRIKVYRNEENLGVAKTRNRGIELAQGEYIAFLDGDDRWLPDKLEKQRACLTTTGCDVCYTGYSFIDVQGDSIRRPYCVPEQFSEQEFLKENFVGCSTAVFRTSILGGTRMRCEYCHEDYVFWLELFQNGVIFRGISQPLTEYRILPNSRSAHKWKTAYGRWHIYRNFLGFGVIKAAIYQMHYIIRGIHKHFF